MAPGWAHGAFGFYSKATSNGKPFRVDGNVKWVAISNVKPTRMEGATNIPIAHDAWGDWATGPFGCVRSCSEWNAAPKVNLLRSHSDWNHSVVIRSGRRFGMDGNFECDISLSLIKWHSERR